MCSVHIRSYYYRVDRDYPSLLASATQHGYRLTCSHLVFRKFPCTRLKQARKLLSAIVLAT